MKIDPETLKKLLQAGAIATDAMSKGSAGGLGKAIVDSKIDLSGKGKNTSTTTTPPKSGASNGAVDIPPTSGNTEDAAGKKFGGQGNKRRNQNNYADMPK